MNEQHSSGPERTDVADAPAQPERLFSPRDVLRAIWDGRRWIIRFTLILLAGVLVYAWLATTKYEAQITLKPKDTSTSASALASLSAGALSLLGQNTLSESVTQFTYTLTSADLAKVLLTRYPDVVKTLLPRWTDPDTHAWTGRPGLIAAGQRFFALLGLTTADNRLKPQPEDVEYALTKQIQIVQD